MQRFVNKILKGDCLEIMQGIPDGSVDMVLCDLPYGVTQNKWDTIIDMNRLWEAYKRIIKSDGVIALTAQGLFTARLIMSNYQWFKYKIVWIKSRATNFLNVNKQPLRRHEDICVFYQKQPYYNPQKVQGVPYDKGVRKDNQSGNYGAFNPGRIYNKDGLRFPVDVQFFEEDMIDWVHFKSDEAKGSFHPTQKPVDLGRWLIRTFTKPGQIILDNCCGSGSFLVSAVLEHRNFIGIEMDELSFHTHGIKANFIDICKARVKTAYSQRGELLF